MLRRLLRILLIPLLLVGLGYASQQTAFLFFQKTQDYVPPPLEGLSPGRSTEPVSQRVVVVVVDGLREDTSHQMPAFQRLRERGADLPAWTELPAISRPGYTTLGTGAYPAFSGVLSNRYNEPVPMDSIFAQTQEAGLSTALVTMVGWDVLYGPWTDYAYVVPWVSGYDLEASAWTTEAIGEEARRVLQEEDAALVYVHFGETDSAGHAYGGESPEYLAAALHVDAQIEALADVLDWSRDTLILTADHGMVAGRSTLFGMGPRVGGGHGGAEPDSRRTPLVMVGRGIAPGAYPDGGQADVVPTVAVLLGRPIPVHSQGRTRLDALVLAPEQRAARALDLGAQQWALYRSYMDLLGTARAEVDGLGQARAAFAEGQYERVQELVQEFLGQLDLAVDRTEANYLWRGRFARLHYLVLPLLAGAIYLGLSRRRRELLWPAGMALLFFALHQLFYRLVRGGTWSLSSIHGMSEASFVLFRISDALVVMGLLALLLGVLWRRRPWEQVVWTANQSALWISWAFSVQLGLFLWLYGPALRWQLPHQGWAFKFFLDLLAALAVGYAGAIFSWLVLGISRLFFLFDRIRAWWGRQASPWSRAQIERLRGWWAGRREAGPVKARRFSPLERLRGWWAGRRKGRERSRRE